MASKKKLKKKIKDLEYKLSLVPIQYKVNSTGLGDYIKCCSDGGSCFNCIGRH